MTRSITAFLSVLIFSAALCLYWVFADMQKELNTPMKIDEPVHITISPGMGITSISNRLVEQGWIKHPYYLVIEVRRQDRSKLIKAGEYEIKPGTTQLQLLDKLVSGKVVQYPLTIPEGLSFEQIIKLVRAEKNLVQAIAGDTVADYEQAVDFVNGSPEGMIYPDTYHFPKGTTDIDFLRRANNMMNEILETEWQQRFTGLPYQNSYDALIMASIIEKETTVTEEKNKIAGVFVRRLKKGMKLQTDPTVIYAMGQSYEGNIRKKDLLVDSPYNTYVYSGLPPTPIASPGHDSIRAALQPDDRSELYFVSRGDGTHQFSTTLEEHNRAIAMYQLNRR